MIKIKTFILSIQSVLVGPVGATLELSVLVLEQFTELGTDFVFKICVWISVFRRKKDLNIRYLVAEILSKNLV